MKEPHTDSLPEDGTAAANAAASEFAPMPEGLPEADMRTCLRVLESIVLDRALLVGVEMKTRHALIEAAARVAMPSDDEERRLRRAFRRQEKKSKRDRDAAIIATTGLRAQRGTFTQPVVPQLAAPRFGASPEEPSTDLPPTATPGIEPTSRAPETELLTPRRCYICKTTFTRLHHFYDAMCTPCGDFNYAKRAQTAPLHGRVVLLTGSRLKIGYHAALILLRAGATVIATTRFPQDSAARFAKEADFADWGTRLRVHGLDLRHTPSVELFCKYLLRHETHLDFLINNAAQTVRRPPGFYSHMLESERRPYDALSEGERTVLQGHEEVVQALRSTGSPQLLARSQASLPTAETDALRASPAVFEGWQKREAGVGLWGSAQLSQVPYDIDDASHGIEVFPTGQLDVDAQQVDLREVNSWRLKLADVATPEMLEVHLVNVVAPFVLNAKLKPLMIAGNATRDRHIVNVSAVEGQFQRGTKTDKHPHTNMAKAALNMMTRTSAQDYVTDGIHMNSVDTGWVTDEDPAAHVARKIEDNNFHPPLDVIDGAARVLDPIFDGLRTGKHVYGKFLKDYRSVEW